MIHRAALIITAYLSASLAVTAAFAVEPVSGSALEELGTPPEPPAGFATSDEALAAVRSGEVPLMNPVVPLPETVEAIADIEYGCVGERALTLDLYRPKQIGSPVPALVFIHGGGWEGGKKNDYRLYCMRFAKHGYVVATISYRLSPEAPFPAAVNDAKCAVRWLRAHAKEYGADPDKIAVLGGSAGGHLSMMVGYSSDVPALEGDGGHSGVSSRVQAVVNLYGPTDLTVEFAHDKAPVINFLSGKQYAEAPELWAQASPLSYVTKDDPPTLILHGTVDDVVPIDQADQLAVKLAEVGVPYVYDRLDGWPHSMDIARPVNERCMWFIDRFLELYLPLPE